MTCTSVFKRAKAFTFLWSFGDQTKRSWEFLAFLLIGTFEYFTYICVLNNIHLLTNLLVNTHLLAITFPNEQPAITWLSLHTVTLLSCPPSQFVTCGLYNAGLGFTKAAGSTVWPAAGKARNKNPGHLSPLNIYQMGYPRLMGFVTRWITSHPMPLQHNTCSRSNSLFLLPSHLVYNETANTVGKSMPLGFLRYNFN